MKIRISDSYDTRALKRARGRLNPSNRALCHLDIRRTVEGRQFAEGSLIVNELSD